MQKLKDWIYLLDSKFPWKTTTIMVWVHGNELSGINALSGILKEIKIISWKIYFIFANLKALEICQRLYEKNLNRCFLNSNIWETYEDKRANEILPFLQKSDYLLDIHNTINAQNSVPFLISEYKELGKYFDIKLIVGWFDNLHPGWSDGYMNTIWKIWLCLESWSIYDPKWPEIAKNGIINFLKFTKNIKGKPIITSNQEFIKFDYIYKNKTMNFKFAREFKDFEKLKAWEIIWYDWKEKIEIDKNGIIVFACLPKNIWDEIFCLGKSLDY